MQVPLRSCKSSSTRAHAQTRLILPSRNNSRLAVYVWHHDVAFRLWCRCIACMNFDHVPTWIFFHWTRYQQAGCAVSKEQIGRSIEVFGGRGAVRPSHVSVNVNVVPFSHILLGT